METNKETTRKMKDCYKIIVDPKTPSKWCVQLLEKTGDWAGIVYSYGEFSIIEPKDETQNPTFKFETDVIYVPERLRDVKFPDEREVELRTLLGQILFDIIQSYSEKSKVVDGKLFLDISNDN